MISLIAFFAVIYTAMAAWMFAAAYNPHHHSRLAAIASAGAVAALWPVAAAIAISRLTSAAWRRQHGRH